MRQTLIYCFEFISRNLLLRPHSFPNELFCYSVLLILSLLFHAFSFHLLVSCLQVSICVSEDITAFTAKVFSIFRRVYTKHETGIPWACYILHILHKYEKIVCYYVWYGGTGKESKLITVIYMPRQFLLRALWMKRKKSKNSTESPLSIFSRSRSKWTCAYEFSARILACLAFQFSRLLNTISMYRCGCAVHTIQRSYATWSLSHTSSIALYYIARYLDMRRNSLIIYFFPWKKGQECFEFMSFVSLRTAVEFFAVGRVRECSQQQLNIGCVWTGCTSQAFFF